MPNTKAVKTTPQIEPIPVSEWLSQARALFGDDPKTWRFECPACGNIQTLADFEAIGAEPQSAYTTCIGRHLKGQTPARNFASTPGSNGKLQPCDFAAFGLFRLSKAPDVIPEGGGKPISVFPFAPIKEARS